ncbi:sugar phosphate isomerase/epimerase [Lewinella aquimaris]|uniref:Sugar phosphate isomerase/epimerase n=1 Tax=Neolewinella aquimaris TaxID=1835722 RepID=A0A840E655_9BACT|nr:metabolite traffic protein EboE [Neolewinella aquimaris]MBB4080661.1 sugar phosphate isomerase/epimerase [Neolewinella aquimaris]
MHLPPHGHLTYCTNIHPGETWTEVKESLRHVLAVKEKLTGGKAFGIGLRLSAVAARQLSEPTALADFKHWLANHDCYVFTMNGFPYGGFHGEAVKDQVHTPDWSTRARVDYTKQLFDILAELLPEGMDGGVSTSPLSYKPWLANLGGGAQEQRTSQMDSHVLEVIDHLAAIYAHTGKDLHLDIEPEPDGLLENSTEFLDFYDRMLANGNENQVRRHLAICYDVCHFAVGYEAPADVLNKLQNAGIRIGRLQISAALKADLTDDRQAVHDSLLPYDEPTYLHQAALRRSDGSVDQFPDLAPALEVMADPEYRELRTHFHVPIYADRYGVLESTNDAIRDSLRIWNAAPYTPHLEVETYTWDVLPDHQRLSLTDSIVRELQWVMDQLSKSAPNPRPKSA